MSRVLASTLLFSCLFGCSGGGSEEAAVERDDGVAAASDEPPCGERSTDEGMVCPPSPDGGPMGDRGGAALADAATDAAVDALPADATPEGDFASPLDEGVDARVDAEPVDAGPDDAGPDDAGPDDAGPDDAASPDASADPPPPRGWPPTCALLPVSAEFPQGDYSRVTSAWTRECWATANQQVALDAIDHVLFIGDGALVEVPGPVRAPGAEYATLRGRLTRRLHHHAVAEGIALEAPEAAWAHDESWYWLEADAPRHVGDFSVCAAPGVGLATLDEALPRDRISDGGEAAPSMLRQCLDEVPAEGRALLVVVALTEYGPRAHGRDLCVLGPDLGEVLVDLLQRLSARFTAAGPMTGYEQVVIAVSNLSSWQAGASAVSACEPAVAADRDVCGPTPVAEFTADIAAINTRLVEEAAASHHFDVVLIDEMARTFGAMCVEESRPGAAPCSPPPEDALAAGGPLRFELVKWCCWTTAPDCAGPDRSGQLGIGLMFERLVETWIGLEEIAPPGP